jgi:nucleoside-diphosphate-sugar epimerase
MKAIVTGASGFVGGALWRRLKADGVDATGLGRRAVAEPGYHVCDLAQGMALAGRPDAVVHAAARSSPWGRRGDFEAQNVEATRAVIRFCETHGYPHLTYVSTAAVMYTEEHQLGLVETAPLPERPINRYAETKRRAEELVRAYAGPWCIVRPRAVFGPGDTVLFPRILRAAQRGRLPLIESAEPVQVDLIYIDTLVDYLRRIVAQRATGLYLLTNDEPVMLLEFLVALFDRLGLARPTRRVPVARAMRLARAVEAIYGLCPWLGEPPVTRFGVSVFAYSKTFNIAKAKRELGPPSVSLAEGVTRFVAWQREQMVQQKGNQT